MRLPEDPQLATETILAAADAGITVFDTARTYGNERLIATALKGRSVRIVTKGGMTRPGGGWVPDGRAKAIRADCDASLEALAGPGIDLYLLHAPDPRTPWSTSVRAIAKLLDDGLVPRIGLCNVNRRQLDQASALAPISAVQVGLSMLDDTAIRGGVLERCEQLGIALIAHSPLGGPRRVSRLPAPPEAALAWLLALSDNVVAIPGASRPETARSSAQAARLRVPVTRPARAHRAAPAADGEVVLVMGIPGAGKSRIASDYVQRGYARLNRDERGGSLRALAAELEQQLAAGTRRTILDNTYLSRAARSHVLEAAADHSLPVRCVWLDTPLDQAQINLILRLLERFDSLPSPEQIRAAREPGVMLPTSQMRALRELEPPSIDEGFAELERIRFTRTGSPELRRSGVLLAAAVLANPGWEALLAQADRSAPHLVFDWRPDARPDALEELAAAVAEQVEGSVQTAVCPHGGGPPSCWCRPPLPGLPLAFAREHGIDPAALTVIGASPAHRTLARALGARFIGAD